MTPQSSTPPAGWYPDPAHRFPVRWWTGEGWTAYVSDGSSTWLDAPDAGRVATATMAASPPTPSSDSAAPARGPEFPLRALGIAFAGFLVGLMAAIALSVPLYLVAPDSTAAAGAVAMIGLYSGFAGAAWAASVKWGTGNPFRDFGTTARVTDLGWGPLVAVVSFAAAVGVAIALSPFDQLQGTNTEFVAEQAATPAGAILVVLSTVVLAPVFEELFFRGLILRSLESRMAVPLAIAIQALLFGLVHVQPDQGLGSISVILATGSLGAVFGAAAHFTRRLAAGMIGHALFNALVVVPLIVGALS